MHPQTSLGVHNLSVVTQCLSNGFQSFSQALMEQRLGYYYLWIIKTHTCPHLATLQEEGIM
jgi:hypothetical protein